MNTMIRCHYTKETIDRVSKSGRYRAIGCGGFVYGFLAFVMVGITIKDPASWLIPEKAAIGMAVVVGFVGMSYLFHWLLCNIEKTTLLHAGDEITLDDNEIRLFQADGTQTTLPRKGLKISSPYYASGRQIFKIRNTRLAESPEIILTSDMENARDLVETIQPGSWDMGE